MVVKQGVDMETMPNFYELLWGGLTTALATVFGVLLRTYSARIKDKNLELIRLQARIDKLERDADEHMDEHIKREGSHE